MAEEFNSRVRVVSRGLNSVRHGILRSADRLSDRFAGSPPPDHAFGVGARSASLSNFAVSDDATDQLGASATHTDDGASSLPSPAPREPTKNISFLPVFSSSEVSHIDRPSKSNSNAPSRSTNTSHMGGNVRVISESKSTIFFEMFWCLAALSLNALLIGVVILLSEGIVVPLDAPLIQHYAGVFVEVVLLYSNILTMKALKHSASCVFGYLLSAQKGFSLVVCGFVQTPPFRKLKFAQTLSLTSPSRKILERLSGLWIAIDLLKLLTPFCAISIYATTFGVYNDVSNCVYFVQDEQIGPVDRKWPTMAVQSGVGEYILGSSLGIMRSESSDPAVASEDIVAAGVDSLLVNEVIQHYEGARFATGLIFGISEQQEQSFTISNILTGVDVCGGTELETSFPLVCSTKIDNHVVAELQILFSTDGTPASIAADTVKLLVGTDLSMVEAGLETTYAILFKAAIQRCYSARATQCPRMNSQQSHKSTVMMQHEGVTCAVILLAAQLAVSLVSVLSYGLWFGSESPIGPAVRATRDYVYFLTLFSSSELACALCELGNAESYAIWQELDVVARIGEGIHSLLNTVGQIVIDKPNLVRALQNGRRYM
ncbi:hypothetical protein HK405_009222 [Cladochytrium tenue]|nr:hypothetical protein HK405_009222 [Cladochytrium tenue]